MNVHVSNHTVVNVIEIDVDDSEDVQEMMTYDDDHQYYPLPYLLDEDQHRLAKI